MSKRRKHSKKSNIKPIPLKTILERTPKQLNRFKPERLRKTYQKLRNIALKRLKRLKEYGFGHTDIFKSNEFEYENPARDLTDVEIKEMILKVRTFLGNPLSTVRGQKKRQRDIEKSAEMFNKIINDEYDFEDQIDEETRFDLVESDEEPELSPEEITDYEQFIDTSDPEQMAQWEEFLAFLMYNAPGMLYDTSPQYYEMWNAWQNSGRYVGKMSHAPTELRDAMLKFFDDAIIVRASESTMSARRRWYRDVVRRRRNKE